MISLNKSSVNTSNSKQKLNEVKQSTIPARKSKNTTLMTTMDDIVKKLMNYKKKVNTKVKLKMLITKRKEVVERRPSISIGTQKLIKSISYIPINTTKRIRQIKDNKNKKLEQVKMNIKKDSPSNKLIYKYRKIPNNKLCFDPSIIKSKINRSMEVTLKYIQSSDEELKICSFRPSTNKRSEKLFAKSVQNKSIVERLIGYTKLKEDRLKKRMEENTPRFIPRTNIKKKYTSQSNSPINESTMNTFIKTVLDKFSKKKEVNGEAPNTLANTSILSKYII